jgi:hypothetical protein
VFGLCGLRVGLVKGQFSTLMLFPLYVSFPFFCELESHCWPHSAFLIYRPGKFPTATQVLPFVSFGGTTCANISMSLKYAWWWGKQIVHWALHQSWRTEGLRCSAFRSQTPPSSDIIWAPGPVLRALNSFSFSLWVCKQCGRAEMSKIAHLSEDTWVTRRSWKFQEKENINFNTQNDIELISSSES